MKPALIATIMLALLVHFTPRSYSQQATANNQKETDNQSPASSDQIHPTTETTSTKNEPPHWYKSPEWVLVIVGLVTAFVIGWQAWETRSAAKAAATSVEAINRQAGILERQTVATEQAAIAAKEGAEATKRSIEVIIAKERPWIMIKPTDLNIESGPHAVHKANYVVSCYGTTPAFIEDSWATTEITESKEPSDSAFHVPMSIGPVIVPIIEGAKKSALVFHGPEGELIGRINARKLFVHFVGEVAYKDFSGTPHKTKFRYIWSVTDMKNFDGTLFACWVKSGKPEDNCET